MCVRRLRALARAADGKTMMLWPTLLTTTTTTTTERRARSRAHTHTRTRMLRAVVPGYHQYNTSALDIYLVLLWHLSARGACPGSAVCGLRRARALRAWRSHRHRSTAQRRVFASAHMPSISAVCWSIFGWYWERRGVVHCK